MDDILFYENDNQYDVVDSKVDQDDTVEIFENNLGKEISIDELQINKSDSVILSGDVNNNNYGVEILGLEEEDISLGEVSGEQAHGTPANVSLSNFDYVYLWTNSNSSNLFKGQTVELSDDINNYDYILFEFKSSVNNTNIGNVIIPSGDLNLREVDQPSFSIGNVIQNASTKPFTLRPIYKVDDTHIAFDGVNYVNGNQYAIPLNIIGLNLKEVSNPVFPDNPSVSGNVVNNYYITVSGNDMLSYNVINKPLKEYTTQEGLTLLSCFMLFVFGFVLIVRKGVLPWN